MKKVSIVLATYKPNLIFFEKLLNSLNKQSYANIELVVRDDSADEPTFLYISDMLKNLITNFSCTLYKNNKNIGSNKTFELLTMDAQGEYIAYCDQDDIWEEEKISKLVEHIEKEDAVLCYSDLAVINENDTIMAKSFRDVHKRLQHLYGENVFGFFIRRNSVTGCTMLIKSDIAKKAIPFCNYYVHDHWLALFASSQGKIAYIKEPLVRYRIHGNNQIGANILIGINSKEDYYNKKLLKERERYKCLLDNNCFNYEQKCKIFNQYKIVENRINFFKKKDIMNTLKMIVSIKNDWQLIAFEIIINFIPQRIVSFLLRKMKSNR